MNTHENEETETDSPSVQKNADRIDTAEATIAQLEQRLATLEASRQPTSRNGMTTVVTAVILWALNKLSHVVEKWFGF